MMRSNYSKRDINYWYKDHSNLIHVDSRYDFGTFYRNNITILFNVLNIFIVVCQKSDRVDIKILENNKYVSIITMGLFILVNFLIVDNLTSCNCC